MGRAPCCDKTKVKRGPWSPEEDTTLKDYIHKYGTGGNWIALPHKAGLKRCGKSCRLRWLNYLRPDIKHGGFTEEEDHVILTLYSKIGSRWSIIASHLQGRTDNDVKNYWNTKMKKKLLVATRSTTNLIVNSDIISTNNAMRFSPRLPPDTSEFPFLMDLNNYQNAGFHLPRLGVTEVQDNDTRATSCNFAVEPSNSQEVSLVSPSFSQETGTYASWSGNGGGEDIDNGFLAELCSGYAADILNGFDFNVTNSTSTCSPSLLTKQHF